MLQYIKTQEEMDKANTELGRSFTYQVPFSGTAKSAVHNLRFGIFNVMFRTIFGIYILIL
jgi:hypothetical protein